MIHCSPTYVSRQLRSADTQMLAVNRTYISFRDSTFAAAETKVWNSLPLDLRQPRLSYHHFSDICHSFVLEKGFTSDGVLRHMSRL